MCISARILEHSTDKESGACPVGRGESCCTFQGQCGGFTRGIMQGKQPGGRKLACGKTTGGTVMRRETGAEKYHLERLCGKLCGKGTLDKILG